MPSTVARMNDLINRFEFKMNRTKLVSRPVEIAIETTTVCNSLCRFCNRQWGRKEEVENQGHLEWALFEKISPWFRYASRVLLGGFGEPLLHPDYGEMIRHIKRHGCYLYFYTNGISLEEHIAEVLVDQQVDNVSISQGGADPETYLKWRGVDAYEKVIENIRGLNTIKKQRNSSLPKITYNIVAVNSILPELKNIIDVAADIGVSFISLQNMVVQDPSLESESPWLRREEALKYVDEAREHGRKKGVELKRLNLEESTDGDCRVLFTHFRLVREGYVMPCSFESFILGDLNVQTPEEIWNGQGYETLRKRYFEQGISEICPNCFVWYNVPDAFLKPNPHSRTTARKIGVNA